MSGQKKCHEASRLLKFSTPNYQKKLIWQFSYNLQYFNDRLEVLLYDR